MKSKTETWHGGLVLLLAHVAGMIDLVALPVWVGTTLIGQYHLSAPLAGGMVTAYLVSAATASMIFAPRFLTINPHKAAPLGYAMAACAFFALTQTRIPALMFALHVAGGFSAGTGLSFVHGSIGRSARPHRLFAIVTLGLGVTGIAFLGVAQSIVPVLGGYILFAMFGSLMAIAAVATAVAYPAPARLVASQVSHYVPTVAGGKRAIAVWIWCAIAGVTIMATSQAMMFSFVERIGVAHGFAEYVRNVLVASALMNLAAAGVAGLLERRLEALKVALGGAVAQATLASIIVFGGGLPAYVFGVLLFVSAMIITHTFVFGWLSQNDSTSRAVALTPAMLMTGAAVGPVLGGLLVATSGFPSLGIVAVVLDAAACLCYLQAFRLRRQFTSTSAGLSTD
jgi:hypothetical protein